MKKITLIITAVFVSATLMAQTNATTIETDISNVSEPVFLGAPNDAGFNEFLLDNILYPEIGEKYGQEGTVVIRFDVLPSGKLSEFRTINSVCAEYDEAVISTLKASEGMWTPGTIDNNPVVRQREVHVAFMMEGNAMYRSAQDYANRAKNRFDKGNYKRALSLYNKAIVLVPNNAETLYQRALAKYYSGDLDGALLDLERIDDLGSELAHQFINQL